MDETGERLLQEALHPARWTERIHLEPDDHDPGSEQLHFQSRQMDNVVRVTPLDLDELTDLLLARRVARRGPGMGAVPILERIAQVRVSLRDLAFARRLLEAPGWLPDAAGKNAAIEADVAAIERVLALLGEA
jgi:hypothetical protein